jgi:hypothetical protein
MGGYREGIGHESLSIFVRPAPNLLSFLDPSSLASGIVALFDPRTEAKQFASLAAQNTKDPRRGPVFWATS